VVAIAFRDCTDPVLGECADLRWLHLGEVGAALDVLEAEGVRSAVLAGKVHKAELYPGPESLRPDSEGLRFLAALPDHRDSSILAAAASLLESRGIRLLEQAEFVPELLGSEGPLGSREPSAAQRADLLVGFRVARALAALDVGQTVVVKDGAVLAVEAIEGTDATILRAGEVASGACVVKVARPEQDPRFDLPVIGIDTLRTVQKARAAVLAFEAGRTLVLDRERLSAVADAAGVAVLGLAERTS